MCLILFQMLHKLTLRLFFSHLLCAEFSFPRIFNGYGSVLNATVGEIVFGDTVTSNMSDYVLVPQGK